MYNSYLYWVNRSLHKAYLDTSGATALTTGANETGMAVNVREVRLIQKSDFINGGMCVRGRV